MPGFLDREMLASKASIYQKSYENDGSLWLPAAGGIGGFQFYSGTWTATRANPGDYYQALTAAAVTTEIVVDLDQVFDKIGTDPIFLDESYPAGTTNYPAAVYNGSETLAQASEGHLIRGIQLTEIDVYFSLGTANLTTHTGALYETTYNTTEAAGSVSTKMAATALGSTTGSDIQIGKLVPSTLYTIGGNASVADATSIADYLEIQVVNPGTSVYHLYGVRLFFNYCIL